jgi:hypothetical protein
VSNTEAHPLAGLTVSVGGRRIEVEDWFDRVFGFQLHSDSDRVVYGHDAGTRMACSFSMPTPWLMVPENTGEPEDEDFGLIGTTATIVEPCLGDYYDCGILPKEPMPVLGESPGNPPVRRGGNRKR